MRGIKGFYLLYLIFISPRKLLIHQNFWTLFISALRVFNSFTHSFTHSLTDWLTDSLKHWLTDWITHKLTDWVLTDWLTLSINLPAFLLLIQNSEIPPSSRLWRVKPEKCGNAPLKTNLSVSYKLIMKTGEAR